MLMPRAPRVMTAGMLLALALPALAACRTSPGVAAYVGEAQVSVAELERAVDERLQDEDVAEFAAGDAPAYTRRVLGFLVEREVHAAVAERFDISVSDADVRARFDELRGERDPEDVYTQLAQERGVARTDLEESIRQQLVREEVAAEAGEADALSEEALRARYEEVREERRQLEFGVVTVPDQATADAVLAELTAAPDRYAAVAARYPGEDTLPQLELRGLDELVGPVAEQLTAVPPGTGFRVEVPEVGVVVYFVTRAVSPTFEALRPELAAAAATQIDEVGTELVQPVREDLDITINPRYGVLSEDGRLVRAEDGVVQILSDRPDVQPAGPGD